MLRRKKWPQPQQARNQKFKKPAKSPMITPRYTRRHFEELNHNILTLTHSSQAVNRLKRGRELERYEVDQQWTHLIQGIYPATSFWLSSKVECPGYDGYWEKHADESSFLQREHRTEFSAFNKPQRNPTVAQRHNWPGCIIMEDSEKNELVVPRISLLALQQLNYLDFVKSVLQANSLWIISPFTMEELWAAVVTKIYHFENTLEKELKIGETSECTPAAYRTLAGDYRSAYEVAKARVEAKRVLQEHKKRGREVAASGMEKDMDGEDRVEEDDQGTHGQDDGAGKRQKIHRSGGSVQVEMASNEVKV